MPLDRDTGCIHIAEGLVVSSRTRVEELSAYFGERLEPPTGPGVWQAYTARDVRCAGQFFVFTFRFEQGRLKIVDFIVRDTPIEAASWDDWSEAKERAHARAYDKWLTAQVGGARSFDWGTVSAQFDPRGGGSDIVLRYRDGDR